MIWKVAPFLLLVVLVVLALWRYAIAPQLFPHPPEMPELARDLPQTGASDEFARRVAAAFPPGTAEVDTIARLQDQSFAVSPEYQTARFEWKTFPCVAVLLVNWTADDGRLTGITGAKKLICP